MTVPSQPGNVSRTPQLEYHGGSGRTDTGIASKADLISPPTISLPKGGGAIHGIGEKFSTNPVTGTGAMSVPIATSPGRSGFGPQLNLTYDSGSGNGPFGFGWSLSLPSITRKTEKGLPRYFDAEESDVFILSGAEDLVPEFERDAGGNFIIENGKHNVYHKLRTVDGVLYNVQRYRPRIEGLFARIERWTRQSDGESHWRSITRDNVTTLYGKENNSRIYDPADTHPDHPTHIFSWLICESYDDKGNHIVYKYKEEDTLGVDLVQVHEKNRTDSGRSANRYLKHIFYGNKVSRLAPPDPVRAGWMFEVLFDYGEGHYTENQPDAEKRIFAQAQIEPPAAKHWPARPDPFSTYRAGFEVRTYRRCQRVLMFHHFAELGRDDYLVRSTDFVYDSNSTASYITSVMQSGYRLEGGGFLKKSLPPLEFFYSHVPTADQLARQPIRAMDAESLENLPHGLDNAAYQWVDLDGEGLSGILTEQADAWFYKRNLGEGNFGPSERVVAKPSLAALNSGRQQLLDLAGDGQIDLVIFAGPTPGFYERTLDESWDNHKSFKQLPNIAWDDPNLRFVDLNGDGYADVLVTEGDVFSWYPSLAEDGFDQVEQVVQPRDEERGPRLVFSDRAQSIYLADMSGDGLTDLVRIRNGEVCYWPNLGYGCFGARVSMDKAPWFDNPDQFDQRRIRLADIDGSGLIDILYLGNGGVRFYYNQSGNTWSESHNLPQFPHIDNLSSVQVLDLLGNGTACLVWSSPLPRDARQSLLYIDLMNGQKPHLLVETNNNLGAKTKIEYAPSTRFYLADKAAGKPWITKLPFPVHCVEKVTIKDKWRNTNFSSTYSYHHGYFDGGEREFRGFGRVEQVDSETYGKFASRNSDSPYITPNKTLYQPPVKTITWFHTGALFDREHILSAFADEYFPNWFEAKNPGQKNVLGSFRENDLPEPDLATDNLSAEEWREALRACKGMALRQEVYELDVDQLDATDSKQIPVRLFSTAYHNCHIRRLQPLAENRHAVFLVVESEAITYNYELDLQQSTLTPDPRIAHTLNLHFDDYGRATQTVAVVYPRLESYSDPANTLKTEELALIHKVQSERHLAYTETHYTEELPDDSDQHRLPSPCEVLTYELTGADSTLGFASSSGLYFTLDNFRSFKLSDTLQDQGTKVVAKLDYQEQPTGDTAHKRIVEWVRMLYFKDDLSGAQLYGKYTWLGLRYETYKLGLTEDLLVDVFGNKLTADVRTKLADSNTSGYLSGANLITRFSPIPVTELAGQYWIRSGIAGFALDATQHFYLPERYEDPFGNLTTLTFDGEYDLFIQSSTDSLGNTVSIEDFDYRVLVPRKMKDANDNYSAVVFDTLGLPVGLAIMGKRLPNDLTESGDTLEGFQADLNPAEVISFFSEAYVPQKAATWLGNATACSVYSFGEQRINNVLTYAQHPACVCSMMREQHVTLLAASGEALKDHLQTVFEYSDGSGQVLVKKIQAEPAPGGSSLRWIASGKTILNNKGKPVKQYEPYFSLTEHRFDTTEAESEIGVTPLMYYDAAGRLVRTELPDGAFGRVEFSPWHMRGFDANDTVKESHWYRVRVLVADATDEEKQAATNASSQKTRAATFAAQHADTPALTIFDSLGRDVITIAHNRTPDANGQWQDDRYLTFTKLDAEGKPLWICDARGNLVMQYISSPKSNHTPLYDLLNPDWRPAYDMPSNAAPCYDIAGNLLFQHSMDTGDRWMLNDAAGKSMLAWDFNQREDTNNAFLDEQRLYTTNYDSLHRPTELWLGIETISTPAVEQYVVERFEYIDTGHFSPFADIAEVKNRNLCGQLYKHYDPSGLVQVKLIDFKGSPLEVQRRLVSDQTVSFTDWQTNPDTKLETETYIQLTEYDALKRMTRLYNWHLLTTVEKRVAVYEPRYNERGALVSEDLVVGAKRNSAASGKRYDEVAGVTQRNEVIKVIGYDAKGQRQYLKLGNGTVTQYDYDPETFRLSQLRTTRPTIELTFPQYHANLNDARVLQQLYYSYDPVGNITEIYDEAYKPAFFQNALIEPRSLYEYDALYRLTKASGRENGAASGSPPQIEGTPQEISFPVTATDALRKYTQEYRYDEVGNILQMSHVAGALGNWTRYYCYAQDSNRLLRTWEGDDNWNSINTTKKTTYQYDTHGNMLNLANVAPGQFLRWDQRDMIASLDLEGGGDAYYQYDAGKQRTRKTLVRSGGNDVEERIYLGGLEIYRRTLNGALIEEIETLHLFDAEQRLLMVDQILETNNARLSEGNLYRYILNNHLGSSTLEVDDVAGIISYEEYHPYGTTAYQSGRNAAEVKLNRYRYTGMERDEESGLSYHTARYYLPWLGRWVSCDPAGLSDGPNVFQYANSSPVLRYDTTGQQSADKDESIISRMQRFGSAYMKRSTELWLSVPISVVMIPVRLLRNPMADEFILTTTWTDEKKRRKFEEFKQQLKAPWEKLSKGVQLNDPTMAGEGWAEVEFQISSVGITLLSFGRVAEETLSSSTQPVGTPIRNYVKPGTTPIRNSKPNQTGTSPVSNKRVTPKTTPAVVEKYPQNFESWLAEKEKNPYGVPTYERDLQPLHELVQRLAPELEKSGVSPADIKISPYKAGSGGGFILPSGEIGLDVEALTRLQGTELGLTAAESAEAVLWHEVAHRKLGHYKNLGPAGDIIYSGADEIAADQLGSSLTINPKVQKALLEHATQPKH
jgi:RHS repeat-associated protein